MSRKRYNFSAGPSVLPLEVKRWATDELTTHGTDGFSVMEISHRSARFHHILNSTKESLKRLLNIPDNYRILFMQGGASLQFSMIPYNFLDSSTVADYIITGYWSEKAATEAKRSGDVRLVFDGAADGFRRIPRNEEIKRSENASYLHFCSNETIHGVEFNYVPESRVPIICDASSNILSKKIDIAEYSLIYAGAQKNVGPSGVTLVIIEEALLERVKENLFSALDYRLFAANNSLLNTPNTWGIFVTGLVCRWLEEIGGLNVIEKENSEKSAMLYEVIDEDDDFYIGHANRDSRSRMNITFHLRNEDLLGRFLGEAEEHGLFGLSGHRSVGGVRASVYNAFPVDGVELLSDFMRTFRRENS